MFFHHDVSGPVELWITDRDGGVSTGPRASLDLGTRHDADAVRQNLALVRAATEVDSLAGMDQVHGRQVAWVSNASTPPVADALMTDVPGLGLLVRVADCVPIVLAAPDDHLAAVVHCGRPGLVAGVVPAAVEALRARGGSTLQAWLGPRVCGRCYELPAPLADDVADVVPQARSTTSWGTPAADIGAGVVAQLHEHDVVVHDPGSGVCTMEDERFFSYRREGAESGRFGAIVVLRDAR